MSGDIQLLALFGEREYFDKYKEYISNYVVQKETKVISQTVRKWYDDNPDAEQVDWEDFKLQFKIKYHPALKEMQYIVFEKIIDNIKAEEINEDVIDTFCDMDTAARIKQVLADKSEDADTWAEVQAIIDERNSVATINQQEEECLVDMDVEHLVDTVVLSGGVEWRLDRLNESVGQIHDSDFIVVGKRPETGGTTFLTSEFTYMLGQLPDNQNAIIFNNEEGGEKVGLRVLQSALNNTTGEVLVDPAAANIEFQKFLDGRRLDVYHKPALSIYDIERQLKDGNYGLIGINVLEKVSGFNNLDDVSRRQRLAEWCRIMADKYGAVFAIIQADGTAEGEKYLNMSQLYGSKTGVQGEIDVLIMIGKDPTVDDKRYFSIAKNKKPTTGRMQPALKHAKFEADFDEERGRFT